MSSPNNAAPVMNYKNACLKPVIEIKVEKPKEEKIEPSYAEECEKALIILSARWEKYRQDYIELYGEDTYEKMYLIPNYWVMPEDESDETDENKNNSDNESLYDDDYYSDYSY